MSPDQVAAMVELANRAEMAGLVGLVVVCLVSGLVAAKALR